MTDTYTTGVTDSGDETGAGSGDTGAPTPWMGRFDATYWQAQAETAIRALEQALATLTRVEAERDAAVAQLTSVKRQLAQTGDTLHAERRAAATQRR
jgi:multidrug resistance efflux pump